MYTRLIKNGLLWYRKKRSILGIDDVEDEEEYDTFEDSPPFINPKSVYEDDVDVSYTRVDHTEEMHLNLVIHMV